MSHDPNLVDALSMWAIAGDDVAVDPFKDTRNRLQQWGFEGTDAEARAYDLAVGDCARLEIARGAAQHSLLSNTEEALNRKWQDRFDEEVRAAVAAEKHELLTRFRGLSEDLVEVVFDAAQELQAHHSSAGTRHRLLMAVNVLRDFLEAQRPTVES